MNVSVITTISNGKPKLSEYQRDKLNKVFKANEGREIQIEVGRHAKSRSSQQNKFYWGVVLKLTAEHTGYTEQELNEVFKDMFLPKKFVKLAGVEVETRKSTTQLTTLEFESFLERVRHFASEQLQITIPLPNE